MDHQIVRLVWLTFGQHLIDRKALKSALTGVSLLAIGVLANACSDVPDAVNPVSWYHGVEGWFEDDEAPPPEVKSAGAAETATTPGTEKSFPSVNDVPDKPATGSTVEQRRAMMENLSADKANAQYIEETQSQSESVSVADSGGSQTEMSSSSETTESEMVAGPAPAAGDTPPPPPPSERPILNLGSPLPPDAGPPPPPAAEAPTAPPPLMDEPGSEPRRQPGSEKVMAASPGSTEIDQVYEQKLQQSAPAVTTAVAGPTEPLPGAAADAGSMEDVPPPQTTGALARSESPVVSAEMQMAAAEMPPTFIGPSTHVSTVYFGNNSAALRASEAEKIRDVAQTYKQRGGKIRIFGYASSRTADMDPVQHQMVNFAVSVRRADAVARALVNQGVKAEDIQTMALSDTQPVYYEFMPAGEAGNRRAEIFVDYQ